MGVAGCGVIGCGWIAHFLRFGLDVVAYDPAPDAPAGVRRSIRQVWPTLERLGLEPGASPDRLTFAGSPADLARQVEVIQENAPEHLETKIELFERLDAAAPPEVVVLSSTSGFAMSDMQVRCQHPGRTVVGHPFNPPYLIPLVEVVGGRNSDADAVDWAADFYTAMGKYALKMSRELPGFIANRLQEALWREALHMVAAGEATVEEIDASIAYGPGLRWAVMGPCLTFHLAGGEGGMAHMLDHFGPALLEPWTRLAAPALTPALRDSMVEGCLREAGERSVAELVRERDDCLIRILEALRDYRSQARA